MADGITLIEAWVKFHTKGVDAAQQREAEKSLESFKVGLTALIATATAAATAVTKATKEMAKGLFTVYYEAQRIGSTVERVTAFGQAVALAGGSAETAKADLETFSKKFRTNPAFREAIKNLGHLSAEDMKDAQNAYIALSKSLSEQRKTDPLKYGQALKFSGLDESTLLAIGRPKFGPAYADNIGFWNKGLDQIAEKSVRLNEDWFKVTQHLNTIFTLASGKWMDIESGMLERFDAFLERHKDLFAKVSDAIAGIFFDKKGKFDDTAFGKRVYNAFWAWVESLDFTKLKNAFIAFGNWLTTGWLADKIKGVFGSIGGAVRGAWGAVEGAFGGCVADSAGQGTPPAAAPATSPAAAPAKPFVPSDHSLGAQSYIGRGGYGPFSHEQTSGALQDFNIPGPGHGFHQIAGNLNDWWEDASDFDAFVGKQRPPHDDEFITHPDFGYNRDPNMPVVDMRQTAMEKLDYNKRQHYIDKLSRLHQFDSRKGLLGGSRGRQWTHDGSQTQNIHVTINSTDPHSAAHETARQLAHLQNQTMRDWRGVG